MLARYPGDVTLQDVSPGGKVLLKQSTGFQRVLLHRDGAPETDISWLNTYSFGVSDDGAVAALFDFSASRRDFFVRFTRDPLPVRFENGIPYLRSLSPDGKWIAVARDKNGKPQTVYVPTGAGEEYTLQAEGVELPTHAAWFHDSTRFLFDGRKNGARTWFIGTVAGGKPRPLSGAAQPGQGSSWLFMAPDDEHYCSLDSDGKWWVRRLSGATPKAIPGLSAADNVLSWTADSKAVFVEGIGSRSTRRIDRVEAETGSRTLWREDAEP